MDFLTLTPALLLPWLLGMVVVLATRNPIYTLDDPGELAWIAGTGYLAGAILATLWMRALSLAAIPFGRMSIAMPLLAISVAGSIFVWYRRDGASLALACRRALAPPPYVGITRLLWWAACAWIALRFLLLGLEVSWQPLFPWEAWIAWATKARVWFELGHMTSFVDAAQWLKSPGSEWFDAQPANPATLPLLQVYVCIALGRWDDVLMNWPWWQFAVALALLTYGGLRRLDATPAEALVGTYFVASLPLANAHVALAGYPELPLAAYFTAATLALLRWASIRARRDFVWAALLAACCPLIKVAGWVWAPILLMGWIVAVAPKLGRKLVITAFAVSAAALLVLARTKVTLAGYTLHLDFAPSWAALVDNTLVFSNWNMLWYGVVAAIVLAWRRTLVPPLLPLSAIVAAHLFLVATLFAFPGVARLVADAPGVERAMLFGAPVLVVFVVLAYREFLVRCRSAPVVVTAAAAAAAEPAPQ